MRLAVAAVIILFVRPLLAAPQWLAMKSSNFELYTSSGEREARETLVVFEQVRAFFMRVKSENVTTHLPVTIVGFRNPKNTSRISRIRSPTPTTTA